jgi:HK97 gp10 family phage protein
VAQDDLDSLLGKFDGLLPHLERNLNTALRMAADAAANEAKVTHLYRDRTSRLTNSIAPDGPTGSFASGTLEAVLTASAPYASFVEKGTKPHVIRPRFRKALRWAAVGGGFAFSRNGVRHPGTQPTKFLENAVDKVTPKLAGELVPDAIELSFVQAGFSRT